ncbi:hypothetical protein HK405_002605 [Cladochytrium tenue]|nr:hypothetical protein HK405_002605 [Cladochytrium tenue]
MATRSKTLLFLQFRSSFARAPASGGSGGAGAVLRRRGGPGGGGADDDEESAGLIANAAAAAGAGGAAGGGVDVVALEMAVLPPKWVDIVDEVDEDMELIKSKS